MTWASRAQPGDRPSVPCPVLSGIIHPVNPGVTASESTLLQSFRVIFYYFRPSPSRWLRLHTEGFSGTVTFQTSSKQRSPYALRLGWGMR